jgi:prolyl-tRNA synthetase
MLRIKDRHDREMLYGPTNEEMITGLFRDDVKSYRDLPRTLYHIQWKFRDEVRPRFGVMRGREFLMKDAYSFDLDEAGARQSYYTQMLAYLRTFQRLGIQAVPMKADSGPIGGDLSHEFIVLAPTGESEVFYDAAYETFDWNQADLKYGDEAGLQGLFDRVNSTYAATDETHDAAKWDKVPDDKKRTGRGIEVGHIFYFGDKYSSSMGLKVSGPDGTPVVPQMGSYGVGVSRLVGAIIEASHDDAGIIWPESIAPWVIGLVNMRHDDPACVAVAEDLYAKLQRFGDIVLYDDRDERGGVKLGSMDVIGLPWQFIIGPKSVAEGMIETKNRRSGQRELIPVDRAVDVIKSMLPAFGKSPTAPDPTL